MNNGKAKLASKILIVEDDKASGILLREILDGCNCNVIDIVASGEEAIEQAKEKQPDLVLMDIELSGKIDGVDAANRIYNDLNIPIIFITAGANEETFERAKMAMPYGYILKPFDINIIKSNVELALYRFDITKKLERSEAINKKILSYIPDIMFRVKPDGSFVSKADVNMVKDVWPGSVAEKALPVIKSALSDSELKLYEYSIDKGKNVKYYEARIVNSLDNTALIVVRNITDKKIAENVLNAYKENLENIVAERTEQLSISNENLKIFSHTIEQSPGYIIILNKEGIVEYVNPKFIDISGYTRDKLIGVNINDQGNTVIPEPELWKKIISSLPWKGEIYNLNKNGEIYYGDAIVTSIKNENNELINYIINADDITEKKKDRIEIEKVKEALEKSDLSMIDMELDWQVWKEKMLSRNISRTDKSLFKNINNSFTQGAGLGSLISLLDMLSSSSKKEDGAYKVDGKIFDLIMDNVDTAKEAFKTFSNLDWIVSNDFSLEKTNFYSFYGLIKAVIAKVNQFTGIKKQRIIINDFEETYRKINVNINKEYLNKAIQEMLMNAMKFSKNNTLITVLVSVVKKHVTVSVTNEPEKGENDIVGIPEDYATVIFEPFYRLSKVVYEQYKSLDFGLGLTLIEKIIGKHGGEVYAGNVLDHSDLKRDPQVKVNISFSLPIIK